MEFVNKFKFDYKFIKVVVAIAIPLLLQQLITTSVNLIDNLMVGQLGDAAVGGVAAVNRFYVIATYGTNGFVNAAAIFIAQFYGARNNQKMQETFRFMLVFSLGIIFAFFLIGFFVPDMIIGFFTKEQAVIDIAVSYMRIASLSFVPMGLTLAIAASMRSIGEMRLPLIASAVAVITNTSLNYCLIFGNFGFPKMGVQGAAIATTIARTLEVIIILCFLKRGNFAFKTKLTDIFKIPGNLAKAIVLKGIPLAANEILWSMGMATLFKLYSTRGMQVMSGYAVAQTISDIFFVLFSGMAAASTVLISQPLGANKLEEGRSNAYKLIGFCVILSMIFGVLMFSCGNLISELYSNITEDAKNVAQTVIRIQSLLFWVYMITTQNYFILRSGGDMKNTFIMDSCFMWLINIPLVASFTYFTDLSYLGLFLVGQTTDLVKLVFSYYLVSKESWVRNITNID